jgi:hypothetical protein
VNINKCEICNTNKMDCERKQYGYKGKFYLTCKSCQEEMKLTGAIITNTAKKLVDEKSDQFALFTKNGKIYGVTSLTATT